MGRTFPCIECQKTVLDSDDALECELCQEWCHFLCVSNYNYTQKYFDKNKNTNKIQYMCPGCQKESTIEDPSIQDERDVSSNQHQTNQCVEQEDKEPVHRAGNEPMIQPTTEDEPGKHRTNVEHGRQSDKGRITEHGTELVGLSTIVPIKEPIVQSAKSDTKLAIKESTEHTSQASIEPTDIDVTSVTGWVSPNSSSLRGYDFMAVPLVKSLTDQTDTVSFGLPKTQPQGTVAIGVDVEHSKCPNIHPNTASVGSDNNTVMRQWGLPAQPQDVEPSHHIPCDPVVHSLPNMELQRRHDSQRGNGLGSQHGSINNQRNSTLLGKHSPSKHNGPRQEGQVSYRGPLTNNQIESMMIGLDNEQGEKQTDSIRTMLEPSNEFDRHHDPMTNTDAVNTPGKYCEDYQAMQALYRDVLKQQAGIPTDECISQVLDNENDCLLPLNQGDYHRIPTTLSNSVQHDGQITPLYGHDVVSLPIGQADQQLLHATNMTPLQRANTHCNKDTNSYESPSRDIGNMSSIHLGTVAGHPHAAQSFPLPNNQTSHHFSLMPFLKLPPQQSHWNTPPPPPPPNTHGTPHFDTTKSQRKAKKRSKQAISSQSKTGVGKRLQQENNETNQNSDTKSIQSNPLPDSQEEPLDLSMKLPSNLKTSLGKLDQISRPLEAPLLHTAGKKIPLLACSLDPKTTTEKPRLQKHHPLTKLKGPFDIQSESTESLPTSSARSKHNKPNKRNPQLDQSSAARSQATGVCKEPEMSNLLGIHSYPASSLLRLLCNLASKHDLHDPSGGSIHRRSHETHRRALSHSSSNLSDSTSSENRVESVRGRPLRHPRSSSESSRQHRPLPLSSIDTTNNMRRGMSAMSTSTSSPATTVHFNSEKSAPPPPEWEDDVNTLGNEKQ